MDVLLRRTENYYLIFFFLFIFFKFIASVLLLNHMLKRTFHARLADSIFKTDGVLIKLTVKHFNSNVQASISL